MTYEKIKNINILFRKDQEKNKDVIPVVTGARGDGKSNFAIWSAHNYVSQFGLICQDCKYEWIFTGKAIYEDGAGYAKAVNNLEQPCPKCKSSNVEHPKKYNFMRFMAYDNEEVEEKINNRDALPDWSPLTCDEAVRWAFSQDFAKSENKEMKKLFNQHRPRRLIQYLNIPRFNRLDSGYREIATYWIWVMQRTDKKALAMIFMQDKASRDDPYRLKELYDLVGSYNEHTPMEKIIEKCQKVLARHPCALDYFMIPPIPDDVYKDYEAYRNAKVFERQQVETYIDQKDIAKVMIFNLMHCWGDFNKKIKMSRFDRPTVRLIEEYLMMHPVSKSPLVRYTTVRNWLKEIRRIVKV